MYMGPQAQYAYMGAQEGMPKTPDYAQTMAGMSRPMPQQAMPQPQQQLAAGFRPGTLTMPAGWGRNTNPALQAISDGNSGVAAQQQATRLARGYGPLMSNPQSQAMASQGGLAANLLPSASGSPGGGMGSYASAIDAGPVYSPAQTASAQGQMMQFGGLPGLSTPGVNPAQRSALGNQYDASMRDRMTEASSNFGRTVAGANAQQLLASQQARANAGLAGGNLLARLSQNQQAAQEPYQNLLSSLLGTVL